MLRALIAAAALTAILAGCGSDDESSAPARADGAVAAAEKAARDEKSKIEIWIGASYKGTVASDTDVCVNQTLTRKAADDLGLSDADRKSYVIVTLPGGKVSEPEVGTCADRDAPDK